MKNTISLIIFILITFSVACVSGLFTASSISDWYITLEKPSFNPPGWVFGPVWTVLYISIACSGWLIWMKKDEKEIKTVMILFFIQLFLNGLWSPLFFGLKKPLWAFIEICFLWIFIGIYTITAKNISIVSFILFIPYWLWVTFASILNFWIYWLNR